MKNPKLTCTIFLVAFPALAGASAWFVYRRAPDGEAAFMGGLVGGVILIITFAWLIAIPDRLFELWLILRARFGAEPREGSTSAIIGTLRGHGDLRAPFTHERCVLYEYEIATTTTTKGGTTFIKPFQGFAMVPLSIEHGVERTRILAKPKIPKIEKTKPAGTMAEANARQYVEETNFELAPSKIPEEFDLSHTDGRLRYDYRREPGDVNLAQCALTERVFRADTDVCAIGQFTGDRRALIGDVTLRTGTNFAVGAAWRVANAVNGAIVFAVIALLAATIFCVNFPLDAAEAAHPQWTLNWWEIDLERSLEKRIRTPLIEAGVLSQPGFHLRDVCNGCASGRLQVHDRVIELKHATYTGGRTVHLSAKRGDRDGVTLDGHDVRLTIDGKTAPVPAGWIQRGDVETALGSEGEYAGRVTVVAPDGWIRCRAYFETRVDENEWLPKR